jgi:hypothetical protein
VVPATPNRGWRDTPAPLPVPARSVRKGKPALADAAGSACFPIGPIRPIGPDPSDPPDPGATSSATPSLDPAGKVGSREEISVQPDEQVEAWDVF